MYVNTYPSNIKQPKQKKITLTEFIMSDDIPGVSGFR